MKSRVSPEDWINHSIKGRGWFTECALKAQQGMNHPSALLTMSWVFLWRNSWGRLYSSCVVKKKELDNIVYVLCVVLFSCWKVKFFREEEKPLLLIPRFRMWGVGSWSSPLCSLVLEKFLSIRGIRGPSAHSTVQKRYFSHCSASLDLSCASLDSYQHKFCCSALLENLSVAFIALVPIPCHFESPGSPF